LGIRDDRGTGHGKLPPLLHYASNTHPILTSFSPTGVILLPNSKPLDLCCKFKPSTGLRWSLPLDGIVMPGPSPNHQYCTPKNKSQDIWNIPQSLNAQGIALVALKNQNIFIMSPAIQLTRTETRKPLHDCERWLEIICGRGRVASMESPMYPIAVEYRA